MKSSTLRRRSLVTAACTLAAALAYGVSIRPLATTTSAAATDTASNLFARLPLAFERNDGQFDGRVRFAARGEGYEVALGATGARLALAERGAAPREVGVRFVGSEPARSMTGTEALPGRTHYYRGNDPSAWATDVPTFSRIRAAGIYPGIDVEYYGRDRQLEYDFLVAAGADPSRIVLAFDGVDGTTVDTTGDLLLQVGARTIRQHRPVAYQMAGGARRPVSADYRVLGGRQVTIALGDYDRGQPLIIDPVLAYSSYFGGNDDDQVRAIAVDANGNIYLTGTTSSTNFPTANAHQGTKPGTNTTTDAFVTKLNPAGTTVFFSTYLGGTSTENNAAETAGSIALDANGNVYVAGDTVSTDFPTTGNAFQPTFGGGSQNPADGFVSKLSATGALTYSTYFGGTDTDHINGIAIASDGDITFSGRTRSSQAEAFPLVNAIDTTLSGPADAFVARLDANGASLVFSTFVGGSGDELQFYDSGHAIDAQDNIFISGLSSSVDYPTTAGAFRTTRTNATNDGFVTKISANGQAILASTWFGGTGGENLVSDVAIAPTGEVVLVGETNTTTGFPLVNATQTTYQGGIRDGFVAKLNATLTGAIFSTYFGGNQRDVIRDVAVDAAGTIHVVGTTGSTNLPLLQPVQPTLASAYDAFITRFGPTGTLTFSTFLGSTQVNEAGLAVGATSTGQTLAAGWTAGTNFPRVNPYQNVFQGGFTDGWLARIGPGADLGIIKGANRTTVEPGQQIGYTISVSNSGPDAASNVLVIDTLPSSLTLVSCAATSGGVCSNIGNAVNVRFATLPLNNSATITIWARVNPQTTPGAAIANGAFLQTDSADPNAANNTSTNTVTVVAPAPDGDSDGDGLPNGWESEYGLDPSTGDAGADPDGDGRTNQQEYQQGTHPRGFVITYFAEGATGSFFDTVIAVANPGNTRALVLTRFQREDGAVIRKYQVVEAHSRATIVVEQIPGMESSSFSTLIEADVPVVADRTMSWDSTGYGGHAERGTLTRATSTWYLAEGATHGAFDLFYLIQNPGDAATTVEVKFLRPAPKAPVIKQYPLGPQSRFTLYVDAIPELAADDLSAVVRTLDGAPIVVERAMYSSLPGQAFAAGHNSAGVTAPATRWFLAEGATGSFFDLYVLIANPSNEAAEVDVEFLLSNGNVVPKHYRIAANSRYTMSVKDEDPRLRDAALSTIVTSANAVPIVVERVMWWPSPIWVEGHNSPGETTTGIKWGLAEGESGGARNKQTYILVANTSDFAGSAKVTLLFEDGTTAERVVALRPKSRVNVPVDVASFPTSANRRYGAVVESLGATPAQIVVERAQYWDANGVSWAAGTNALATKLQ
jgi:uncharacterized repeat protein (TIGR01451 family)